MEDAYPSSYFASKMEIVHKFSSLFSLETPKIIEELRREESSIDT
jgi:hypothetical protein